MHTKSAIAAVYASLALAVSEAIATPTLTTLVDFNNFSFGSASSGLIADGSGNLYGETATPEFGVYGTVFKIAGEITLDTRPSGPSLNRRSTIFVSRSCAERPWYFLARTNIVTVNMEESKSQRLAFIGLGIMGKPMAGHLLGSGNPLAVYTRSKNKADDLIAKGARWADSPTAAAASADVVFICVTDTPDVEAVLLGDSGVIHTARPGTIVVDHSTISPEATREFAKKLAAKGVTLLDAPVSGGDLGARNATLSIMVGGDETAFQKVTPLLSKMGKTLTHCGPSGNGQLTKLVNQILVSVTNLAVCEAMALATTGGLDAAKTITAVAGGAAGSWQLSNLGPKMIAGDFAPGFMIDLQHKDLRLVLEAAKQAGVKLETTTRVAGLFDQLRQQGLGREGTQALFKAVRD